MDDDIAILEKPFDIVFMGTGLTNTILSGILSKKGWRVLHFDKNDYYGGDGASLNITQIYKKFRGNNAKPPPKYLPERKWAVDLIAKFMMANGDLTEILLSFSEVLHNIEFTNIAGSYVGQERTNIVGSKSLLFKVPATPKDVLSFSLNVMELKRLKTFLTHFSEFNPKSEDSMFGGVNLAETTMKQIYDEFGLQNNTREFVGHVIALYSNDEDYLEKPARPTIERIVLYFRSVTKFENAKSPYLYPMYGLGELPSAFTRLSAVHGGTYMLNTEFLGFEYDEDKKVKGVNIKFENPKKKDEFIEQFITTPLVVADPDYFPEGEKKVATGKKVVRAICILNHSVNETKGDDSAQIIIPQSEANRKNDIYIAVTSSAKKVCPPGYFVAIVSTIAQSPNTHEELKKAFEILDPIEEIFISPPVELYKQKGGDGDGIFVTNTMDDTSHFESCTADVFDLYKRITGEALNFEEFTKSTSQEAKTD